MASVNIDTTHTAISDNDTTPFQDVLSKERERIRKATKKGYEDERCSVNLSRDAELFYASEQLAQAYKDVDVLVIVGIGGSNLGTLAVLQAIHGNYYSERSPKTLFLDTTDPEDTQDVLLQVDAALADKQRVLVNVISKSGSTAETIKNFSVLLHVLDNHDVAYSDSVVATTDEGSKLYVFAQKRDIPTLIIPQNVGGRYSVFSPVGIFPLTLLGIDTENLLKGASDALKQSLEGTDIAATLAANQFVHADRGKHIINLFFFAKRFSAIGAWYRQLLAESIGKEKTRAGATVHTGITPTTSIGSTDLHSVAQLYLAGPKDKAFLFMSVQEHVRVGGERTPADDIVSGLAGVSHNTLYDAILQGTLQAFSKQDIPYTHLTLLTGSEEEVGFLLQTLMLQVIYLGALYDINPFDQPAVELYKKETRSVLSQ